MRAAYTAFQDGSDPDSILKAVDPARGSHDSFYTHLVRFTIQAHSLNVQCRLPKTPCSPSSRNIAYVLIGSSLTRHLA